MVYWCLLNYVFLWHIVRPLYQTRFWPYGSPNLFHPSVFSDHKKIAQFPISDLIKFLQERTACDVLFFSLSKLAAFSFLPDWQWETSPWGVGHTCSWPGKTVFYHIIILFTQPVLLSADGPCPYFLPDQNDIVHWPSALRALDPVHLYNNRANGRPIVASGEMAALCSACMKCSGLPRFNLLQLSMKYFVMHKSFFRVSSLLKMYFFAYLQY